MCTWIAPFAEATGPKGKSVRERGQKAARFAQLRGAAQSDDSYVMAKSHDPQRLNLRRRSRGSAERLARVTTLLHDARPEK